MLKKFILLIPITMLFWNSISVIAEMPLNEELEQTSNIISEMPLNEELGQIPNIIAKMSLDEKIGQMLCLDFKYWRKDENDSKIPVTEINDAISDIIARYHIGSVILFSQNFVDKVQAKHLIDELQDSAIKSGNPPLMIAVDQEGGIVERFHFDREKLKNNGEIKTQDEAFEKGKIIANELKELGITCDLAPVVDVNSNPDNPVIGIRSFSNNPEIVSELGIKFLEGLHSEGIIGTAKHFPGHGDTDTDSHSTLPIVNKTLEELEKVELKPFKALTDAGVDMVMTAHVALPKVETETVTSKEDGEIICLPATLSKKILIDILRKQVGFNGVIITDALNMKAIKRHFGKKEAAKTAIKAGADILCMPVKIRGVIDISKLDELVKYLKEAVEHKEIDEKQIDDSVERILKLKKYFNANSLNKKI